MSEGIPCYLLEPIQRTRRFLRRYNGDSHGQCPEGHGYHDAMVFLDEVSELDEQGQERTTGDNWPHDDPHWPPSCACGYVFQPGDGWQLFQRGLWRRADTGKIMTLDESTPGAIWHAYWMPEKYYVDGQYLICRCPGNHDWCIDSRAGNRN
jgi:hypothetical protein